MSNTVLYNVSNQVATITLNKPRRRNALDPETLGLMKDAFNRAGVTDLPA